MKRARLFRSARKAADPIHISATGIGTDSSIKQEVTTKGINVKKDTSNVTQSKKIRGTVDLEMMKEELKQLEDPPTTEQEKNLCSKRLQLSFFDVTCTDLARNLLGKILVRRLENGMILKGRIVETEAYLGEIDKASQTYQLRITPRNLPLYMAPGTIYVYMTYGMYHCFNISSAEPGTLVVIRALEVLIETDYVELLRNSESKIGKKVKLMSDNIKSIKPRELCNHPSKICTAFAIDLDDLHEKELWNMSSIWIENDPNEPSSVFIVNAPRSNDHRGESIAKLTRYYVLGNPCVGKRNVEFEDRAYIL